MTDNTGWDRAYETQGRLWGGGSFPLWPLPEQARILELGCGSGKMTPVLAQTVRDLIALDFSPHACRLTQKLHAGGDFVDVLTADARMIPLSSGCVDAVIACHVLGHQLSADRILLIQEATRVLKTGGELQFCDFSVGDFRAGTGREIEPQTYLRGSGIITHYFTEDEVVSLFGGMILQQVEVLRHPIRVRGRNYPREEIRARCKKR